MVSASKNIKKSLVAALAPLLRAFAIWRKGSKTTRAPCFFAMCCVLSVELLSTTMISPLWDMESIAKRRLERVEGRRASSLYAGIMTEYTKSLLEDELSRGIELIIIIFFY